MTRLRTIVGVLALGFVAAAAGCGGDARVESRPRTPASTAPPGTAPAGTTNPSTGTGGVALDVYFVRGEKVGVAHRRVAPTRAVGRAALDALVAGPTASEKAAGLTSAVPAGTRVLGLDIANGLATVDLSSEFVSGGGSLSMRERLAQVVFTLTQFPTVQKVSFRINGTPTTVFGGEGVMLDPRVDETAFTDVTPFILLQSVAPGDLVTSPVTVAGLNNTFESNVRVQVLGADRRVLADTFTTGTGGMGTWGPFSKSVTFDRGRDASGYVVVFDNSAESGSVIDRVEVPVRFS